MTPSVEWPAIVHDGFEIEPERTERILIVNESQLVCRVFCNTLSPAYDCFSANSYTEAMECLSLFEFDLIIADVVLPGSSPIEFLRRVNRDYPDVAMIIVSSVPVPYDVSDPISSDAFDYLKQPCELRVLKLAVERTLEGQRNSWHRDDRKDRQYSTVN
jgi:DNA-binding NtrC family response regulator